MGFWSFGQRFGSSKCFRLHISTDPWEDEKKDEKKKEEDSRKPGLA